jgi:predicted transcriptional regulator
MTMRTNSTVARGNVYFEARLRAAQNDYRYNSRESASEMIYVHERTLADYERGITTPPPDVVIRMADMYGAPELLNHFCANECPAGRGRINKVDELTPPHIATRLRVATADLSSILLSLDRIAADGVVDQSEMPVLLDATQELAKLKKVIEELELMTSKLNRKEMM